MALGKIYGARLGAFVSCMSFFYSASDWKFGADQLKSRFGSEVLVHCKFLIYFL